jgi:hypothetical protein
MGAWHQDGLADWLSSQYNFDFDSARHSVDSTATASTRSKVRLLAPADSESAHATAASTIRQATESSELPSASRLRERSHDPPGRSYIGPAIFIPATRPDHGGFPSSNKARPRTRYENAPFQDQHEHSVCNTKHPKHFKIHNEMRVMYYTKPAMNTTTISLQNILMKNNK